MMGRQTTNSLRESAHAAILGTNPFLTCRESNQLDLVEGLRMVGLSTTECREPAPAARSTNPKHDEIGSSVQKHKHGMYGECRFSLLGISILSVHTNHASR